MLYDLSAFKGFARNETTTTISFMEFENHLHLKGATVAKAIFTNHKMNQS
jgi:hypothetical protein